jgi:transcriptional regulator with XRE-family HTH domain
MTKIQRVRKICKWLIFIDYADNDADLAKKLGYTKSSFSQIMNEKVPLSDKFVNTIVNSNENINIVWINDGEGDMLIDKSNGTMPFYENSIIKIREVEDRIKFYKEMIEFIEQKLQDCEDEKKRIKTIS